jgi:NAD(P)-dependent dehydrogenase (short-subunit alcohol dehydrogenase family)
MLRQLLEGQRAVVTEISTGIGRTVAELFSEEGANVVLTTRGKELLLEVAAGITAVQDSVAVRVSGLLRAEPSCHRWIGGACKPRPSPAASSGIWPSGTGLGGGLPR